MINSVEKEDFLGFLNPFVENAKKQFKKIDCFFTSIFEKKPVENRPYPLTLIAARVQYDKILPDEILLQIFNFLPVGMRLSSFREVSYQFYTLSHGFSFRCYQLHLLGLKVQKIFQEGVDKPRFYALDFKEEQKISLYQIKTHCADFDPIVFSTTLKSIYPSLHPDEFDLLLFAAEFVDQCAFRISLKIENIEVANEIQLVQKNSINPEGSGHIKIIRDCCNLSEATLDKVATALIKYKQELSSMESFDSLHLYKRLLLYFTEEEREAFLKLIKVLEKIGLPFDEWVEFILSKSKWAKKNLVDNFSSLTSLPHDELVINLKRLLAEILARFTFKCQQKTTLFVNKTAQNLFEYGIMDPQSILRDEHRWLAARITKPLSNGKK